MRDFPIPNPFVALRSFLSGERLFGRDEDLVLVDSRLISAPTTLLFAPSGVGKTSFLNARLTPAVKKRGWFVIPHREWAVRPPLEAVIESVRQSLSPGGATTPTLLAQFPAADKETPPRTYLLILDQFEEVFQHWSDTRALDEFALELARLLQSNAIDVRVILSMREEFLGELSLFDNLIPELFNNSYRLKNPTRSQAEEIIVKTSASRQVDCGDGLEPLLDDLLRLPRSQAPLPADSDPSPARRIPMPFLQIVCHRLWEQQLGARRNTQGAPPEVFLESPAPDQVALVLESFCREKLNTLTPEERDLAASAFGFLMTRSGVKLAYPVDLLAEQVRVSEPKLLAALEKLSADDVRMLRRIPAGPRKKPWFELYHDLYAQFLLRWKQEHEKEREEERARAREAETRKLIATVTRTKSLAYGGLALTLAAAISYAVFGYLRIREFCARPTLVVNSQAYEAARSATNSLLYVPLVSRLVHQHWARYWTQRAQLELLSGVSGSWDNAILAQMQSLVEDPSSDLAKRQLSEWTSSYAQPVRTYRLPGPSPSWGYVDDAKRVYAVLDKCRILFWNRLPASGFEERTLEKEGCLGIIEISPHGSYAMAYVKDGLALFQIGKEIGPLWRLESVANYVPQVRFSPDEATFAIQANQTLRLFSIKNKREVTAFSDPAALVPAPWAYSRTGEVFRHSLDSSGAGMLTATTPDGVQGETIRLNDEWKNVSGLLLLDQNRLVLENFGLLTLISRTGEKRWASSPGLLPIGLPALPVLGPPSRTWYASGNGVDLLYLTNDGINRVSPAGGIESTELFRLPPDDFGLQFLDASPDGNVLLFDLARNLLREFKLVKQVPVPTVTIPEGHQVRTISPDGRWLITLGSNTYVLKDVAGQMPDRPLIVTGKGCCEFNPSGTRLSYTGTDGTLATLETAGARLEPRTLDQRGGTFTWASDDYLVGSEARKTRLINIKTGRAEFQSENITSYWVNSDGSNFVATEASGSAMVDSNPLITLPTRLTLYRRHADGTWNTSTPLKDSEDVIPAGFSRDGSSFMAAIGLGNVLRIWTLNQPASAPHAITHGTQLAPANFGTAPGSVIACSSPLSVASELLAWDLSQASVTWRTPVQSCGVVVNRNASATVVTAGRRLAWLSGSRAEEPVFRVRHLPSAFSLAATLGLAYNVANLAADGTVRILANTPLGATSLAYAALKPDFSDIPPYSLPPSKSWRDVAADWSTKLD